MKRIFTLISAVIMTAVLFGQVPSSFKYQAILREASGNVRSNANVGIDVAILQGSATGIQVFIETHVVTTSEFGLVNIEIGSKNPTGFSEIDWSAGPYFIKINVDNIEMGTSQLLSVPYALHAKTAENGFSGDYSDLSNTPDFTGWDNIELDDFRGSYIDLTNKPSNIDEDKTDDVTLTGNQTIAGNKTFTGATTVANPVNATDAATKAYVDALLQRIETLELVNEGFVDSRDGNHYDAIKIGNQTWMAENLKYLPSVVGPGTGSETTPYSYVYGYDGTDVNAAKATSNYTTYGVLYNWPAAMAGSASSTANPSGLQGVCPTGWHLPSDAEWTELTDYLGGESVAGGKLKETSTTHWSSPNIGATNETGFTALPGGCHYSGTFGYIGYFGYLWCATEENATNAWLRSMANDYSRVFRPSSNTELGFSVRCLRDL